MSTKKNSKPKIAKKETVKKKKVKKITKATIKKNLKKKLPEHHYFVMVSGQKVKNVKELADTLEAIDEELFRHHVNDVKNDFSNWIQDIFEETDLAEELKKEKSKDKTRLIIYKHISKHFW